MAPRDIAEVLGKSVGSVKVLLGEMVKAGQVSNPSYGRYVLPDGAPYSLTPLTLRTAGAARVRTVRRVSAMRARFGRLRARVRRGRRLLPVRPGTPLPQGRRLGVREHSVERLRGYSRAGGKAA
jgi:hypothetical protein